jgi:ferredoxin/flavodoxin---NADP+ reductase
MKPGSAERPLRVAVIGSGPAGFFMADALFREPDLHVRIDMFERLPLPFGLVRYGAAPDHPRVREVSRLFESLAEDARFRFIGNVTIGADVAIEELRRFYEVIVFATGAERSRAMGIPGEDLPGSYSASAFVGWYNGHPDYRDRIFDLSAERAVIIGHGNVALDVARMLAKSVDELRQTDIAQHATGVLAESRVREIHIIGRRGPAQAKFSQPELKEMGRLENAACIVDPADLVLNEASRAELRRASTALTMKTFTKLADMPLDNTKARRIFIRFFLNPLRITGKNRTESVLFARNTLEGDAFTQHPRETGETLEEPCGLAFRAVGWRGIALPGAPFHADHGIIPNEGGRVRNEAGPVPGLYAAGWIKRGAEGVIGSNRKDCLETASKIREDLPDLTPCVTPDTEALLRLLREERGIRPVSYEEARRIDRAEIERGAAAGKVRERFTSAAEMLAVLNS